MITDGSRASLEYILTLERGGSAKNAVDRYLAIISECANAQLAWRCGAQAIRRRRNPTRSGPRVAHPPGTSSRRILWPALFV
jgi:hypothetical protein